MPGLEANSGPGEFDEKLGETINTLEQFASQIKEGIKKKIELLKKGAWEKAWKRNLHFF